MSQANYNTGQLNKLVTPRYPTPGRGTAGGTKVNTWTVTTKVWGYWLSQSSREYLQAFARYSDLTGVFRMRFRTDIRSTWRILIDGVLYEVLGPAIEVGRRQQIDVPLRSLNGAGLEDALVDELGNPITDDSGTPITT